MTAKSRTATKFIVRFDNEEMHAEAKQAAQEDHTSLNSFILQAVEEKLGRGKAMDKLLELIEKGLIPHNITNVISVTQSDS